MSPSEPRSRRDFLRGRTARGGDSAAKSKQNLSGDNQDASTDPTTRPYLMTVSRRAMACEFQAYFNAGQYAQAEEAALAAFDLVEQIESQLTIYRPESELSQLNRHAGDDPVSVELNLFELLQRSFEIGAQTDEAFDITAGPLSKVWGFARREGRVPEASELSAALAHIGRPLVQLDGQQQTVHYLDPQVEINLGGIGKGYALDAAVESLESDGLSDVLLHGGKSSVVARGSNADLERGWVVGLVHPLNPKQRLAEVTLIDKALSTSGSGTQSITHQGRRLGHILDPRTGWPAEGVLSATVVTASAAEADALSTALFVMGVDRAREFCQSRPEVQVALMVPDERQGAVRMESFNLAADDWKFLDR